ncbi:DUF4260 domain-containing protein [Lutibaculum baratangense]|uniref:DUF4260 domain-containing protein n=1 Tax=Lutibaculum baratangense AMV1 TaxID=631454 RepID=V4RI69_9HYPH|nr:DUF4260 domain-containing protein [Lutibaculum baratangense]ESR25831.1 hypothetical protein N177_1166 [Lutibaculum baratangense AMV1]
MTGFVTGAPRALLRLEGLLVLAAAILYYAGLDASWWLFAFLFFGPDLSMAGYLAGPKAGAAIYNTAHCYGLPLALIACGGLMPSPQALAIGLIWAAHIGFDRALGYGLKYGEGFGASHLGRIGKTKEPD